MITRTSSTENPNKAAGALSAMLAFNVFPTEAFQPMFLAPSVGMIQRSPAFSRIAAPAPVTMDCTPWDMGCHAEAGGLQQRPRQGQNMPTSAMVLGPYGLFEGTNNNARRQLEISDPSIVQDNDEVYSLAFGVPAGIDHDGLEVSVSDRLLTVKARMTRDEDSGPSTSRGGWVTRSSTTESISRSFVLPEGLSTSTATASLVADGKAEVVFHKRKGGKAAEAAEAAVSPSTTAATSSVLPLTTAATSSVSPSTTAATSSVSPSATAATSSKTVPISSAKKTSDASAAVDHDPNTSGGDATATARDLTAPSPAGVTASPAAERPLPRPESTFETLDREFRELTEALWGEEMVERLRVPTQEELAEREAEAKRARAKREAELKERAKALMEARAKRMMAMRRQMMTADISSSEDGSSYLVKVALPEGTTRDRVKLTVNPDNSLRVTVSDAPTAAAAAAASSGVRSVYKHVLLPKDAVISEISAKFEAEEVENGGERKEDGISNEEQNEADGVSAAAATAAVVSGVEITVGRAVPPQPRRIDIL